MIGAIFFFLLLRIHLVLYIDAFRAYMVATMTYMV
jgi:hypothetical protein